VCVYKGERVVLRGWGRREKREEVDDGNSLGGKQRSAFRLSGPPLGVGLLLFFPPPSASRSGEIREAEWKREREMETSKIPLPPHPLYSVHVYVFHDRVCALFTYRNYFSIRNPFGDIGRK
jgi:hypothetical protein